MDKDSHTIFVISDESDSNDPDSDTEVESLISTPEVEIVNDISDSDSVTLSVSLLSGSPSIRKSSYIS